VANRGASNITPMCALAMETQGFQASWKILDSPGIFIGKFPGPGKFRKMTLVLESSLNLLATSWKVL